MSKFTKLQLILGDALNKRADDQQVVEVIDAMAEWFDILLEDMGVEPASIPSLLRWQYLHSDYANKLALGIETMTELSPAAQAVLDAYRSSHLSINNLAAALRALADQVVPVPIKAQTPEEHWALLGVKNRLLAIADELEAQ